jgi:hypothetical protein
MRALALAGLFLLASCYAETRPAQVPPPPPSAPPPAPPAPPPGAPPRAATPAPPAPRTPPPGYLTEAQAIHLGFREADDRGLSVSRVDHAFLDSRGNWHVELRGRDRVLVLLEGRTGKLLKGRFKQNGPPVTGPGPHAPAPAAPPPPPPGGTTPPPPPGAPAPTAKPAPVPPGPQAPDRPTDHDELDEPEQR